MAGLEIELKAGLDPATARTLRRRLARRAGPSSSVTLAATYFDTADRRLKAAGLALRVRREGRAWIQTVKWARKGEGGFQETREADCRVKGRNPDLAALADPMLRNMLDDLLAGAEMEPWFTTRVRRQLWTVRHSIGLVEVALDSGHIDAGALAEPVLEAEFELKQGSPEAVFALAAELLGDQPVDLLLPSKAARGVRLAERAAPSSPMRRPRAFDPDGPAAEAWRSALATLATVIAAELHRLLTDEDPEGPHQLRVALRRLRVLQTVCRPILDPDVAQEIAEGARQIGRMVGPLRDSDVLTGLLCASGRADLTLADALATAGDHVRTEVRAALRAGGATGFAIRLLQLANLGGWQRSGRHAPVAIGKLLDRRMNRQWKALKRLGDRLSTLDEEERHEFRKQAKKVRYLLEIYGDSVTTKEFKSRLKKLQEALGDLNDLHILDVWQPSLPADAESAFLAAREALIRAAGGKADTALGRSCRHWRTLSGLEHPYATAGPQPHPEPSR